MLGVGDDILGLGSPEDVSEFRSGVRDVCSDPARIRSENGQIQKRIGDVVGEVENGGTSRSKGAC